MIEVTHHGVKLPKFVPCMGDRCPEMMQLEGELANEVFGNVPLRYRCLRRHGYRSPKTGEQYTGNCYFHDNPYKADDYAYWHRNADNKTPRVRRMETSV